MYTLLYILLVTQPIDHLAKQASLIIGLSLLNGFTPTFDTWFQSQVRAKFSVYAQNAAFLIASAVRIWMILSRKSLLAFAWAAVIEAFLAALFLWIVFARQERDWADWRFNWRLAKRWLSESWTLLLSSLAIMIYMRIDQVMLARMADVHAVGVYSAAVRVSEIGYFIPMMLASTLLPSIVRSRSLPQTEYQAKRQRFFDLNSVVAFAVIVPGAILAKWIIQLLYGATYSESVSILVIRYLVGIICFHGRCARPIFIERKSPPLFPVFNRGGCGAEHRFKFHPDPQKRRPRSGMGYTDRLCDLGFCVVILLQTSA